jgi:cytosine/adenosine deaminase-related metal-dependent hydrolase
MKVPAFVNGHTHLAMGALRGITGSGSFDGNVVEDLFFKLEVLPTVGNAVGT